MAPIAAASRSIPKDGESARHLYECALQSQPDCLDLINGIGWALCRLGRQAEALPWLWRAVVASPENSTMLSDYGWALAELGRYDEAQEILEKAVRLAPAVDDLPANNLARVHQLKLRRRRVRPSPASRACPPA